MKTTKFQNAIRAALLAAGYVEVTRGNATKRMKFAGVDGTRLYVGPRSVRQNKDGDDMDFPVRASTVAEWRHNGGLLLKGGRS